MHAWALKDFESQYLCFFLVSVLNFGTIVFFV